MTLIAPDKIDAAVTEYTTGIGAMTEPRPLTTGEWREFASQLETDNERLVRVGWDLQKKLTKAENDLVELHVSAETRCGQLEREIARLRRERPLACFAGIVGGGMTALLVVWALVAP